jgi:RHS repeat-associated protein
MFEANWGEGNLEGYRYGFNSKEDDFEVKGQQDYGMRIYDKRLGRFKSIDPLTREYPWNSTYAFAENDVIRCIDLDGLEKLALSGASLPSQYYLPMANGFNTPGHTGYKKTHVKFFKAQAERLQKLYGYHAFQVFTGEELVKRMVDETTNHGNISSLVLFAHGGTSGIYLNYDQGLYSTRTNSTGIAGSATIADIQGMMASGAIKFSQNAICFIDACKVAGAGQLNSETPAYEFVLATGVTTIAATGNVLMVDETKADGRFKTTGEFLKLTRVEYMQTIQVANPDKKWWQFWKSDTVEEKVKSYYVQSESLGNELNMDDYIEQ